MIIACHHISKAFLEQPILSDVTFQLEKGEHAALVGVNGAGKTTLLRILLGETEPDSGSIARTPGLSIGYLSQTQDLTSSRSIREEVESAMAPLFTMEKEVLALEKALEEASAGEDPLAATSRLEAYEALLERFVEAGGRTFAERSGLS